MIETPDPGTPADEALLARIAAGDADAFAELFRRRQGEVYRFALHMSASKPIAEDVTQDVFLQVMHAPARFDARRGTVGAWLLGIARNFVRRRVGHDRELQPLVDDESRRPVDVPGKAADVLTDLTRAERIEILRRSILSLPVRYREAVVLCDLHEMTYADAAAALDCAVGTVRSRLHRGRALLGAKMAAVERLPESPGTPAVSSQSAARSRTRCLA